MIFNISYWLYMLLLLIGLDLAQVSISRSWLAPRVLLIPCLVMVGSMIAGVLISLVTGEQLAVALALSTGFGCLVYRGHWPGNIWAMRTAVPLY